MTTTRNVKLNKDRWVIGQMTEVGPRDETRRFFALVKMGVLLHNGYSLRLK